MSLNRADKISDYSAVVFYRKAWFWFLTVLLFMPFAVLIGLTGEVYTGIDKNGKIIIFPKVYRIILSLCYLFLILLKIFGPMFILLAP